MINAKITLDKHHSKIHTYASLVTGSIARLAQTLVLTKCRINNQVHNQIYTLYNIIGYTNVHSLYNYYIYIYKNINLQ